MAFGFGQVSLKRRTREGGTEALRSRQATANRVWGGIFLPALNQAFHNGEVPSDAAWRRVKLFRGVDTARLRYLTVPECQRLINVCDPGCGAWCRPRCRRVVATRASASARP